jgi:DNA processing protein
MTVGRLNVLLGHLAPAEAFAVVTGDAVATGMVAQLLDTAGLAAAWMASARCRPPEQVWERCCTQGIRVVLRGQADYPAALLNDPMPASVLFVRGNLDVLRGRRVGIVGTRNATGSGRDTATMLGHDLAAAGVHVVSGLARGIDGCAHRGALSAQLAAPPIAVVASGLDVVYPREHANLWNRVAEVGVLISEAPPATAPEAYRFPLRNRILAALSEVLVVVESRVSGGSLITVNEARDRGVLVMAVPGALRNRAAEGTNALVRDGCPVVLDVDDVLIALGLDSRRAGGVAYDPRPRPNRADGELLALLTEPRTLDQLVLLTEQSLVECAMAVARLESDGWVEQVNGWFERARDASTVG